jgi:hypothetical protein
VIGTNASRGGALIDKIAEAVKDHRDNRISDFWRHKGDRGPLFLSREGP